MHHFNIEYCRYIIRINPKVSPEMACLRYLEEGGSIAAQFNSLYELVDTHKESLKRLNIGVFVTPSDSIDEAIKGIPVGSPIDLDMDYLQS
jgi:hypothetical protein